MSHKAKETGTQPKCYCCVSDGEKRIFSDNCAVSNHMRVVRLYEYPFKCRKNSWCMRKFSNTNDARGHKKCVRMKVKKAIYPIQFKWDCYFCGKGYSWLSQLSSHLCRSHTFEKPFRCNLCYAEFYKSTGVQKHITFKHAREFSYRCKYCKFRAMAYWQLYWHCRKLHNKEILHSCNICKASCDTIYNLREHITLHRHKDLFVCYFCVKAFKVRYLLFQHMQRSHLREAATMWNSTKETENRKIRNKIS